MDSPWTRRVGHDLATFTFTLHLDSLEPLGFTLPRFNPTSLVTDFQAFVQNPLLHPDLSILQCSKRLSLVLFSTQTYSFGNPL